jgi:hypothetical protein
MTKNLSKAQMRDDYEAKKWAMITSSEEDFTTEELQALLSKTKHGAKLLKGGQPNVGYKYHSTVFKDGIECTPVAISKHDIEYIAGARKRGENVMEDYGIVATENYHKPSGCFIPLNMCKIDVAERICYVPFRIPHWETPYFGSGDMWDEVGSYKTWQRDCVADFHKVDDRWNAEIIGSFESID